LIRLSAVVAALLAGWILFTWLDVGAPAIADLEVLQLELADLPEPTAVAVAGASFELRSPPFRFKAPFGVARLKVQVDDPAQASLALFIRRVRDNYMVLVNGQLAAHAPGNLSAQPTLDGIQPRLVRFLPALLRPGENTIDIIAARNTSPPFLREVFFGPAERLEPAYRHAVSMLRDSAEFGAFAAAMVLLFALAITPLIRNRALTITIALTLGFFLARQIQILWIGIAWPQALRDCLFMLLASGVWLSCAAFVNEWTRGPRLVRWIIAWAAAVSAVVLVTFYLTMPVLKASNAAALWESLIELTTFPYMAWRLFHFYREEPPTAWGEIFTATVCLMMAIASILTQTDIFPALAHLHTVEGEAFVQFGALSIVAFIAVGLARQSVGIYSLAAMNNETLALRISQKEQELQAHHDTMRSQEAERTLVTERGRIMADVHDGIGSQLLGLMLQARSGKVAREEMADGLQAALDDLYLVIDSLDTVEENLENVLGAYRARIAPKCEAAGIALDWQIEGLQTGRMSAPTTMLQLCRILQEAISNAIRHGKATRIRMLLSEAAGQTTVTLTDNGSGFDPSTVEGLGRGLTSMRKRAASIGAQLAFTNANPGCRISITLPSAASAAHP
jgi:two-component system, NarL family, sensor histidine kinase UhpB